MHHTELRNITLISLRVKLVRTDALRIDTLHHLYETPFALTVTFLGRSSH